MPDRSTVPRRERVFKLSHAERENQIIRIYCGLCRKARRYFPKDMITLLGDQPVYDLADDMKCDDCKRRGHMTARCESIVGSDIGRKQVRRLVEVKTKKLAVWSDEVL